ncbi:MAG: hypothetical protein MUF14_02960 [Hyphomonadaceae bacterium]|jgi:hypothetical protein|nr:hypothetical protein [Hyphomonadaceae bacterium]
MASLASVTCAGSLDHSAQALPQVAGNRASEAREAYVRGYRQLYARPGVLAKVLLRGARHLVFTFAICIAAAARDDDPASWLTLARLKKVAADHRTASPGQVAAIVARMLDLKLLRAEPQPGLVRKQRLHPTETLLAHHRELLAVQATASAMVHDEPGLQRLIDGDREFAAQAAQASLDAFADGVAFLIRHPAMLDFVQRDCGLIALFAVVEAAWASPDRRTVTGLDLAALAQSLNVSVVHLRSIMQHAFDIGFLRDVSAGNGSTWLMTDAMQQALDHWIDDAMALFTQCCRNARLGRLAD